MQEKHRKYKKKKYLTVWGPHGPLFFSYFISKTPEMPAVWASTARKRRRSYRTTFPNQETPYSTACGISWPYRTGFRVSYQFRVGNRGGGVHFLQHSFTLFVDEPIQRR